MWILFVYTLLKVVSYYDLSVLSMSVMGFKNSLNGGWVGGVSSIQFYLGFLEFFNFAKPHTMCVISAIVMPLIMPGDIPLPTALHMQPPPLHGILKRQPMARYG